MTLYKRDKWRFLTTVVGHDRYTIPIFEASARGKCVPLFKTMMATKCQNNCKFCSFRSERATLREQWKPEELAKVSIAAWQQRKIHGLFLSSSVDRDPNTMVEQELETVKILRDKGFTYISGLCPELTGN
jgi:predicted DNA-binding helix-hairpin-helix protein